MRDLCENFKMWIHVNFELHARKNENSAPQIKKFLFKSIPLACLDKKIPHPQTADILRKNGARHPPDCK